MGNDVDKKSIIKVDTVQYIIPECGSRSGFASLSTY